MNLCSNNKQSHPQDCLKLGLDLPSSNVGHLSINCIQPFYVTLGEGVNSLFYVLGR